MVGCTSRGYAGMGFRLLVGVTVQCENLSRRLGVVNIGEIFATMKNDLRVSRKYPAPHAISAISETKQSTICSLVPTMPSNAITLERNQPKLECPPSQKPPEQSHQTNAPLHHEHAQTWNKYLEISPLLIQDK